MDIFTGKFESMENKLSQPLDQGSEAGMELSELIDCESLQKLMDEFYAFTKLPMSIVDMKGKVLVGIGWQSICIDFHRANPESYRNCIECDTILTRNIEPGTFKLYRCKNNMWDVATPIMLDNLQIGNIFMGQFFFDDEIIDEALFITQARNFGYNADDYLKALKQVPLLSRETVNQAMRFFSHFSQMISLMGHQQLKLKRSVAEKDAMVNELSNKEEIFKKLVLTLPDVIIRTHLDGTIFFINDVAFQILPGQSREDFIGRNMLAFIADRDLERAVLNTKEMFDRPLGPQEYRLKFPGDIELDCEINGDVVYDARHNPVEMVYAIRDISFRKKTEAEIQLKSMVLDQIKDHVTITDLNGVISFVNQAQVDLLQLNKDDILGKPTTVFGEDPGYGPTQSEILQRTLNDGEWRFVVTNFSADGNKHFMDCRTQVIRDSAGKPIAICGISTDITHRLLTEKALEESEARFKALHNASFGGIAIHDKGVILDCNQGLSVLTGYTIDELTGMDGLLLIAEQSRDRVMKNILSGYEKPYEAFGARKNGEEYPMRLEARNIPYKGVWMRSVEFRDISEQKRAEAELIAAKELAEENSRLKTAFLANMSHELRTPINAIMGFSDLMKDAEADEKLQFADIVQKSSQKLVTLIDDVVLLSRLQSEKILLTEMEFRPADIVNEIYRIHELSARHKAIDLKVNIPAGHENMTIISDVDKIRQTLLIFASNAMKYTLEGSIKLGFAIEEGAVEFFVEDTGIGMADDELQRIFENFYRGRRVIAKAIGGTGLGLNIAHELVNLLGSKIRVITREGKGSRFSFSIPVKSTAEITPEATPQRELQQNWPDCAILIAEDEPDNFLFLDFLLKNKVKRIDHANDGAEAVKMAMQNTYDLILMDLKMPVMNGLEATIEIRKHYPSLPVIAQTAYAQPEERNLALQSGCNDHIEKPLIKEKLFALFNKYLITKGCQ